MIKDILALVEDGDRGARFLKSVGALAKSRSAHLDVAALTPSPMVAPAMAPFGSIYVPEVVLMGSGEANVACVRDHLTETGCDFDVIGFHNDLAWLAGDVRRSRQIADVIIAGDEEGWPTPWLRTRVLQTVIRSAGTPVILLPEGGTLPAIRRAVLGWKPGPEATRALHDLVALAEPGATIDIVSVGAKLADCERGAAVHAEVKAHLLRHGFKAEGHWIVTDDRIEADTLKAYAKEVDAGLLAIGGFAHSRIRDIILGGVTREFVAHTDLPILISR